jgi:hypothetical protein
MGNYARPGSATQFGHAPDVVGMPVCQQDRVHLADPSPCGLDGTCHLVGSPRNPGVHQHHAIVDDDGVCLHVSEGDFNHTVDDLSHAVILAFSRQDMNGRRR